MQPIESMSSNYANRLAPSLVSSNALEAEPIEVVQERAPSARKLLHIVFKRKWLVLMCFVVCAAGSVTVLVLLSSNPVYLATSQLLISPAREQIVEGSAGGPAPPWLGFNAVEQTAWTVEMLKGRFLAERVVKAIGPAVLYPSSPKKDLELLGLISSVWVQKLSSEDEQTLHEVAIRTFLNNVDAKPVGRSSIVQLSFRHESPEMAARVVNLLGEMYMERHLGVQRNAETDAFFQEQLLALKRTLADTQEKIRAFKQLHGVTGSVDEEKRLAMEQLISLRRELNKNRSEQPQVQTRAAEVRRQLASTARTPSKIEQLREKITTLEIQENELSLRMTAQHPTLHSLRKEIDTLRQSLSELVPANLYGTSSRESLHANLEEELLRNEAEAKAMRAREGAQTAQIAEHQMRLDALERIQPEFSRLQNQLQIEENNHRLYLTKFEESRIARAMDAHKITSVRVIEQAYPPSSQIESNRNTQTILAIVASAVGAVALAFLLHLADDTLDTSYDVERVLDLPVLASIPARRAAQAGSDIVRLIDRRADIPASTSAQG